MKIKCIHCGKIEKISDDELTEGHKKGTAEYICDACNTPDWTNECEVCGATPVHRISGMCGPCTFGEAATVGGNW